MSKCLEDEEPISLLSLDSCEPALLADVISLMSNSHRSIMMLLYFVLLKTSLYNYVCMNMPVVKSLNTAVYNYST